MEGFPAIISMHAIQLKLNSPIPTRSFFHLTVAFSDQPLVSSTSAPRLDVRHRPLAALPDLLHKASALPLNQLVVLGRVSVKTASVCRYIRRADVLQLGEVGYTGG